MLSVVILVLSLSTCLCQVYYQPEQIHIAHGGRPTEMIISWVTMSDTSHSVVEYGMSKLDQVMKGSMTRFVDGGSERRVIYMHRVTLTDLIPGQLYRYHVGSIYGWSGVYQFHSMKSGSNWNPRFIVYGDMGNINAQSLPRLQEEVLTGKVDFIIHAGDFAYDMNTYNAQVGDEFMRQIEPIAAYVPYMTCVGNHEAAYNFSNYKSRFSMPNAGGDGESMWFSFNVGPVHIIFWSSEAYYYYNYGTEQIFNQYRWLENDLKEANSPRNRTLRPWIITVTHRPMYCSNSNDKEHCQIVENTVRVGDSSKGWLSPETLLYKYGVDLEIGAHEHSYERMWPVFNRTVCNGTASDPYRNPRAPVHIVTGSAGCQEGLTPFLRHRLPWSALASDDYGYNRFHVINNTHLSVEYVSDNKGGEVIDKMVITKDKHGAGLYDCHH